MLRNMRRFIKTDYESVWAREINLIRRNICALIKEVNQQKDMVLISVETCLLCRVEFVAWVFCIYYACQSDAQPDTRVLLFCHREPNTHTHTHESVRQLCKSSSPTSELKTNCKFAYRSTVARFLRRTRCKYYKKKPKNITLCLNEILKILFLLRFVRK